VGSAEFVVHVYFPATGPDAKRASEDLTRLWQRCSYHLNLTKRVQGYAINLRCGDRPGDGDVLAARRRDGPGKHQILVRRIHDTLCLALLCAPGTRTQSEHPWAALEAGWDAVLRAETDSEHGSALDTALGTVSVLQARLADGGPAPSQDDMTALIGGPHPAGSPTWGPPASSGSLQCWEDVRDRAGEGWHRRRTRRFAVLAPADKDAELSAWTWSRGDPALTPFAHYLRHAAVLRHEVQVWKEAPLQELRRDADAAIATVLRQVARPDSPGRAQLSDAATRLLDLRARESGLVDRLTRVRDLERSAAVAARNMNAHAPDPPDPQGLFADDRELAEWFARQLDGERTALETVLERSREASALADLTAQRGRERVNLALTGVVGTLLMVLAAIQAFGYRVPVPDRVQPAIIASLGSVALLASLAVVRLIGAERRWTRWALGASALLLIASLAWIPVAALGGPG
jgi:hypothetical protein